MIVVTVVGARPQFIKAASVSAALREAGIVELLVHTGQHYDDEMSEVFFRQLGLAPPHINLGVGSGSHGSQVGAMLPALEQAILTEGPDRVLVYGDTNSTLAGALAACKLLIAIDHVEAGLRSFDRDMPEELNRVLTDHAADQLFCPTANAVDNLRHEGIVDDVYNVGDVMLDQSLNSREVALGLPLPDGVTSGAFFVATLHRPSNTDEATRLRRVLEALERVGERIAPVVLPVHPRLAARMLALDVRCPNVRMVPPVGYLEMQSLLLHSRGVITDSGGVQKEALFVGLPCITLRDTTEWPETIEAGLNTLVGEGLGDITELADHCRGRRSVPASVLDGFGGGRAAPRIADAIRSAGRERRRRRAVR